MTNSVTVSGVLFALEPVRSPGRYVQAVFINPELVHVIRAEGNAIYFRITKDIEVEDTVSMKEIAGSIIESSANVIWEMSVHYKDVPTPSYAPSF